MSFPKQSEIELPLLKTLQELGGKAEPKELYPRLAAIFPQLTQEDLTARLPSSPSTFRWHNLVQWSRQKLVEKGEIDGSTRGVWKLTPRGRARATGATADSSEEISEPQISSSSACRFSVRLVTSSSKLLVGAQTAASTASAYSDKVLSRFALLFRRSAGGKIRSAARRLTSSAARSKAIMTTGYFLTTGRFTADAEAASIKKGAISLLLLDGDTIAESMIRNGIGVVRRPVQLFDLDPEFFRFPAADGFL